MVSHFEEKTNKLLRSNEENIWTNYE